MGDSSFLLNQALVELTSLKQIDRIETSQFYRSSPVGCATSQNFFVNAVCRFKTNLDPKTLLKHLQRIEKKLGKIPKPKDAPRPIDIDILFYGSLSYKDEELEIPHPHWHSRLFVLVPLNELTSKIEVIDADQPTEFVLEDLIHDLKRSSLQLVSLLDEK